MFSRSVVFCDAKQTINRELEHERFWDADGNWKWAIFTFNLPSHNNIHILKNPFSITDE